MSMSSSPSGSDDDLGDAFLYQVAQAEALIPQGVASIPAESATMTNMEQNTSSDDEDMAAKGPGSGNALSLDTAAYTCRETVSMYDYVCILDTLCVRAARSLTREELGIFLSEGKG